MKRIIVPIIALSLGLTGCMLKGKWSFVSTSKTYCDLTYCKKEKKVKPTKCRTLYKFPGKFRGCKVGVKGHVKFSANKRGWFTRAVKLTIKCPGKKVVTKKSVFKAKFMLVKKKGKTYLLLKNRHGMMRVLMKKKLNKLRFVRVSVRPVFAVKNGQMYLKAVRMVDVENYRK